MAHKKDLSAQNIFFENKKDCAIVGTHIFQQLKLSFQILKTIFEQRSHISTRTKQVLNWQLVQREMDLVKYINSNISNVFCNTAWHCIFSANVTFISDTKNNFRAKKSHFNTHKTQPRTTWTSRGTKVNMPISRWGEYILTLSSLCPRKVYFCVKGCRKKFGKRSPDDLVVTTRERFSPKGRSKISNFYYHLNEECLKKGNPEFTMKQIIVPPELRYILTDGHRAELKRLNINLS